MRGRVSELARRWREHGFVQVHRGYVANLRRAVEVRPRENGTAVLAFSTGARSPWPGVTWPGCGGSSWRERGEGPARPRRRARARPRPRRMATYLGRLIRAQLRLSLLALGAFGGLVGSLPLLFLLGPRSRTGTCCARPRAGPGGAAVPADRGDRPALPAPGRRARRDLPRRRHPRMIAAAAVVACHRGDRPGVWGVRLARTTSDLLRGVAGDHALVERRRRSRASTCRRRASWASPGWG